MQLGHVTDLSCWCSTIDIMDVLAYVYQKADHVTIMWLQESIWFSLGCAADKVGQVELAVKAYQRSVTLDPDVSGQL